MSGGYENPGNVYIVYEPGMVDSNVSGGYENPGNVYMSPGWLECVWRV